MRNPEQMTKMARQAKKKAKTSRAKPKEQINEKVESKRAKTNERMTKKVKLKSGALWAKKRINKR